MTDRSTHLFPETGTIQPECSYAHGQGQYPLPPYDSAQGQPALASHAFWLPIVQAQVANVAPIFPRSQYPRPEVTYSAGII